MNIPRRDFLKAAAAGSLAATLPLGAAGAAAADDRAGDVQSDSWMGWLSDHVRLDRMTLPGTHDTCCTDPNHGTEWSHTQNMGIPEQLQRGIRFFDIRCGRLQDQPQRFGIYHANYYQYITFDDVLDQTRSFLGQHPQELVLMRVKNEHELTNDQFTSTFENYVTNRGYADLFWFGDHVPALGEARGRIVPVLQGYTGPRTLLRWPDGDNDFMSNQWFELQDKYNVSNDDKRAAIVQHFDKALADQDSGKLYINFISLAPSSYNVFTWPKYLADQIVPTLENYLDSHRPQMAHLGVVPMDFPDFHVTAARQLWQWNFGWFHQARSV
ncbi:phosphatidylinositol-specific phospholipase C [Streptomyces silvisoli]|uniref:1-phosphatidylinositol phosphodiesterase n=1 Tax=Streptomyces silvisoli TaxID=3034235 RepID=A0ABT5ZGR1_9ACTN|nr:phosphatidylinositol-specific phospholipase C [Streptomyces silvisoli]MDF3288188.1 phosphatidylinositol-specific phospholipase C [Streptomyces silvisoli]